MNRKKTSPKKRKESKIIVQILLILITAGIANELYQLLSMFEPWIKIDDSSFRLLFTVFLPLSLPLSIILAIRSKKWWGLFSIVSIVYIYLGRHNYSDGVYSYLAPVLVLYIFYIILKYFEVRSIYFLVFTLLNYLAFNVFIAIFISLFLIVCKLIYLLLSENKHIIVDMGIGKFALNIVKTLPYWSILLLLFLPGYFLVNRAQQSAMKVVYSQTFVRDWYPFMNFNNLPYDIKYGVDSVMNAATNSLIVKIENAKERSGNDIGKFKATAQQAFEDIIPTGDKLIPERHVGTIDIVGRIDRAIRKGIRKKFDAQRTELKRIYLAKLDTLCNQGTAGASELADFSVDKLQNEINPIIEKSTDQIFQVIIFSLNFCRFFNALMFAFILVYSFFYVFSRISVNVKNNLSATLNHGDSQSKRGTIKACGQKYLLSKRNKGVFYYGRKIDAFGCPPALAVPFWKTSVLSRLRNRFYLLNKVDMSQNPTSVYFTASGSQQLVEWKLNDGEELIFNYRNLILISGSITLQRIKTFRITSLLLGRVFFKVAKGPGIVVLQTNGKPVVSGEKSTRLSVSADNILAWNRNAEFDVVANNNVLNMFFSGYNLRVRNSEFVLIDADRRRNAKTGLARFIRSFALPF